jgi:hypothetical protein
MTSMPAVEQNRIGPQTVYNHRWLVADDLVIGTAGKVSVCEGRDRHHTLGFTCHELEETDMCRVSLAQPTAIVGSQTVADDLGANGMLMIRFSPRARQARRHPGCSRQIKLSTRKEDLHE